MPLCECFSWCRTDIKFRDGKPLPMTQHHPRCSRVDESLIDVWRFTHDGSSYVTDQEPTPEAAREAQESEVTITREKMHREIFERLEEFAGF